MKIKIIGTLSTKSHPHLTKTVQEAIENIPRPVRSLLQKTEILLAKRLIDIDPAYASKNYAAYGLSMEYSWASYRRTSRSVRIAQECKDKESGLYIKARGNPAHMLFHELGHALDYALAGSLTEGFSKSANAEAAYEKDLDALSQRARNEQHHIHETLNYYLPKNWSYLGKAVTEEKARREVFAQAFSNILGGMQTSSDPYADSMHKDVFRNFYIWVEKTMRSIDPDVVLHPRTGTNHNNSSPPTKKLQFIP